MRSTVPWCNDYIFISKISLWQISEEFWFGYWSTFVRQHKFVQKNLIQTGSVF